MKISSILVCTLFAFVSLFSRKNLAVDAAFSRYVMRLLLNNPFFGGYSILISSLLNRQGLPMIGDRSVIIEESKPYVPLSSNRDLNRGDVLEDITGEFFFYIQNSQNDDTVKSVVIKVSDGMCETDRPINQFKLIKRREDEREVKYLDYTMRDGVNDVFIVYNSVGDTALLLSTVHQFIFCASMTNIDKFICDTLQAKLKQKKTQSKFIPPAPPAAVAPVTPVSILKKKTFVESDEYSSTIIRFKGRSSSFDDCFYTSPDSVVFSKNSSRVKIYFGERDDGRSTERILFIKNELVSMLLRKKLSPEDAMTIISTAKKIFADEDTVQRIDVSNQQKLVVVGDIHGQLEDLLSIFNKNCRKYLFNGDYVDRGEYSLECLALLYALKITYPAYVFLNRGNHESETCGKEKFFDDCRILDPTGGVYKAAQESFKHLPLAATIRDVIYVVHAGIRGHFKISELKRINRAELNENDEFFFVSLWDDPSDNAGITSNKARGDLCSCFGPDETAKFLTSNRFDYIIRSHMLNKNGLSYHHDKRCWTLFSAPRYCNNFFNNKGAVIEYDSVLEPKVYTFD